MDVWLCPWTENDLRAGGKFRAIIEAKDGSFGFDFEAMYDEMQKHMNNFKKYVEQLV